MAITANESTAGVGDHRGQQPLAREQHDRPEHQSGDARDDDSGRTLIGVREPEDHRLGQQPR